MLKSCIYLSFDVMRMAGQSSRNSAGQELPRHIAQAGALLPSVGRLGGIAMDRFRLSFLFQAVWIG